MARGWLTCQIAVTDRRQCNETQLATVARNWGNSTCGGQSCSTRIHRMGRIHWHRRQHTRIRCIARADRPCQENSNHSGEDEGSVTTPALDRNTPEVDICSPPKGPCPMKPINGNASSTQSTIRQRTFALPNKAFRKPGPRHDIETRTARNPQQRTARLVAVFLHENRARNLQRRIRHHVRFRRRWRIGHHWGWRP